MKRLGLAPAYLLGLFLFGGVALSQRPQEVRTDRTPIDLPGGSRVEFTSMESAALKGRGEYSIFLPPSYQKGGGPYPVVYFLHGLFNDHTSWTVDRHGNLPAKVEELMVAKKIPEMILVHPNGGRSFYTNYRDGSMNVEDFVVKDLVGHVESAYRVTKSRAGRAIAGTSMGGYGALKIAFKHPDLYAAVAAHSPIVLLGKNPLDVPPEMKQSQRYAFFYDIFAGIYGDPIDQAYYDANNVLLLAKRPDLKGLGIYFDYGTADRYNQTIQLGEGLKTLDKVLASGGVPHTFSEYPGEPHGWELVFTHLDTSLRFVSQAF